MLEFILGFVTCYFATAGVLLRSCWRKDPPAGVLDALGEVVVMLGWPVAFLTDGWRED